MVGQYSKDVKPNADSGVCGATTHSGNANGYRLLVRPNGALGALTYIGGDCVRQKGRRGPFV